MAQSADTRPEPNHQRKAAIAYGGARDHRGKVRVTPIPNFDLNRTIFNTLEGKLARWVMRKRVAIEVHWNPDDAATVESDYDAAIEGLTLPAIPADLMQFLLDDCDFDVEHADGSFLDHLYFGYEYCTKHYSEGSAIVMLLHSILGTGTNTFAMTADKIPALEALLSDSDWKQIEAFPSVLRLLYSGEIREELRANLGKTLTGVSMHRVIDNARLELTGDEFWEALNYQLVHLVDFLPVANWSARQSDTSYILFRDLHDLLERAGQRVAQVDNPAAAGPAKLEGEDLGFGGWLVSKIPVSTAERLASKSVRAFSAQCGHSLDFELRWE